MENSTVFDTYDDIASQLMSDHFKINAVPDNIYESISYTDYKDHDDFRLFIRRELRTVLIKQHNHESPGYDDVDALREKIFAKNNTL